MSVPAVQPFFSDARGNRLDSWTVTPHGVGHHLWLRGTAEMAYQIRLAEPNYQEVSLPPSAGYQWTHVLFSPVGLRQEIVALLELLTRVITLPALEHVGAAYALDWYKVPQEGVDPYSWSNTDVGQLVNSGKYRYRSNPQEQARVGRALVGRLCAAVSPHPTLASAEVILDVPGHDTARVSFGSRVAATVAKDTQKRFVSTECRQPYRPEAKSLSSQQIAAMIRNQFYVAERLDGKAVLIVDDVFHSGQSLQEVARAARIAGAASVNALCGVRTMRR